jgi:hypothetical protein
MLLSRVSKNFFCTSGHSIADSAYVPLQYKKTTSFSLLYQQYYKEISVKKEKSFAPSIPVPMHDQTLFQNVMNLQFTALIHY